MYFLDLLCFFVIYERFNYDKYIAMFIDTVPNRKSLPTILIRHSYREGGKVKKHTLANITKLPPEIIEKIRKILRGAVLAMRPPSLKAHSRSPGRCGTGTSPTFLPKKRGRPKKATRIDD